MPRRGSGLSLFWRVFVINGAVFLTGVAFLAFSPLTVSARVRGHEIVVLLVGLVVILVANGLLLRATLAPLDRLDRQMREVDLLRPGARLPDQGGGAIRHLLRTFNAMLDRLESERSEAGARALAAQEGERQRIARELHDEIGQSLTAVLLGLSRVVARAPEDLREELELVREGARSGLEDVRQIARRLRPGVLADLGLGNALISLTGEFAAVAGVDLHRRIEAGTGFGDQIDLVIYRIAQEGLTNVARHSGATRVDLSLRRRGPSVVLTVQDDGRGLGGTREGAGMRGMRERALLVGADLRITGGDAGTELCLTVPLGSS